MAHENRYLPKAFEKDFPNDAKGSVPDDSLKGVLGFKDAIMHIHLEPGRDILTQGAQRFQTNPL